MKPEDVTPVEVPQIIVRNNRVPPKLGAIVMYVLASHDSAVFQGRTRPAVIVDLVDDGSQDGLVCLQVFTNGGFDQLPSVHHAKDVLHDEDDRKPGTWHWPEPRQLVFRATPPAPAPKPKEKPNEPDTGTIDFASLKEPFKSEPFSAPFDRGFHVEDPMRDVPPPSSDDEDGGAGGFRQ
jgi:hypothetical protein